MFRRHLNIQYPLLNPDPAPGSAGVADKPELTKNEIIDFLGEDDEDKDNDIIPLEDKGKEDKKDEKDDKKAKESEEDSDEDNTEDEDDDLKALEEELKDDEPDEEKLELTTPTSRREILKKYPNIFKDFPYLETAYYREQEFTKILPTIKDAKLAVDKAQTLDRFETDLINGNTEDILKSVKSADEKAFNKIVDEYLPTLNKVDPTAYHHVIGNTIRHVIMSMVDEASSTENEALKHAAAILNQFAFGSSKFKPPSKLSTDEKPVDNEKEKEISEREKKYVRQKFNNANTDLSNKVSKTLRTTIEAHIDPKKSMPDYVRKHAVREAIEELEGLMSKDSRFQVIKDKLWEKAFQDDFSDESVDRIYRAFKSKAGTLLASVIKKSRNEALKGLNRRVKDDDDDSRPDNESKKGEESRRRNDSKKGDESHRRSDSGKKVPDGMSSLEYLMSED